MNESRGYSRALLYTWRGLALLALIGVFVLYGDDEIVWLLVWSLFSVWLADGDIRTRLMPRQVIYTGMTLTLVAVIVMIIISDVGWTLLRDAAIGGLSAFVALSVMRVLSSGAIGGGDVRLAGLLGIGAGTLLGPFGGLITVAAGWLFHGVFALSGLAGRVFTMETRLPLGPSLVLGAFVVVLASSLL